MAGDPAGAGRHAGSTAARQGTGEQRPGRPEGRVDGREGVWEGQAGLYGLQPGQVGPAGRQPVQHGVQQAAPLPLMSPGSPPRLVGSGSGSGLRDVEA